MGVVMQQPAEEMVDSYEVRIGHECVKHHFGRKVPIRQAVRLVRAWLNTFDKEHR